MFPKLLAGGRSSSRSGNLSVLSLCLLLLQFVVTSASPTPKANLIARALGSFAEDVSAMVDALRVMQAHYFNGTAWPTAIDWTAAVMGTQVSATLSSIASLPKSVMSAQTRDSLLSQYFRDIVAFYGPGGENWQAVEGQAYDDMQWVALEWLEAIKFVNLYGSSAYQQYIPEFAQRSLRLYNDASVGWDTTLCGGGMLWNPRLLPYKNAITNELYVASSVGMYLYHPAHDRRFLDAAVEAYRWLVNVNMTNSKGLYVDGYHIHGYQNSTNLGTARCDERSEDVYTYNQGVILSGLRGLWQATGQRKYLDDGHALIQNVIAATGWPQNLAGQNVGVWHGIGSDGILQETCDAAGTCSQDAQTFKGIYFHHMSLFCLPLLIEQMQQGPNRAATELAASHTSQCNSYASWVQHNAEAAYATRNGTGDFGMWWGVGSAVQPTTAERIGNPANKTDIMNNGVPVNSKWRKPAPNDDYEQSPGMLAAPVTRATVPDPNARGRGRTVETQSGGLAVLRALITMFDPRPKP